MTKEEAKTEALQRWRALPVSERRTQQQAEVFAATLAEQLDFRTMGNERKVIAAWLIRDLAGLTHVKTPARRTARRAAPVVPPTPPDR